MLVGLIRIKTIDKQKDEELGFEKGSSAGWVVSSGETDDEEKIVIITFNKPGIELIIISIICQHNHFKMLCGARTNLFPTHNINRRSMIS